MLDHIPIRLDELFRADGLPQADTVVEFGNMTIDVAQEIRLKVFSSKFLKVSSS